MNLLLLLLFIGVTDAFIPHPLLAYGAMATNSLTHSEITGLGFLRSLAQYLYETQILPSRSNSSQSISDEEFLTTKYTINDLYKLAHPELDRFDIELYTLPVKFILDTLMTQNVLVDFNPKTKKLSAAHFDSEAFLNGSRRILQLRRTVIRDAIGTNSNLTRARISLGQLFHTLQDFYSHSNWVEMGQTDINRLIGLNETIGTVARPDQATCTADGCTRIEKKCSVWQHFTLGVCPLVYYDCKNNILPQINEQQLLTSGYLLNQFRESYETLSKPTNVEKCSHGSVLDESSHIPVVGGINKDASTVVLSPHHDLHQQAADMAIKATENFLNNLRREIGNDNFDRLFAIHPTGAECQMASSAVADGQRYRFFSPSLAASLKKEETLWVRWKNFWRKVTYFVDTAFSGGLLGNADINQPTYDLTDQGVDVKDVKDYRSAPTNGTITETRRKKRLIEFVRSK